MADRKVRRRILVDGANPMDREYGTWCDPIYELHGKILEKDESGILFQDYYGDTYDVTANDVAYIKYGMKSQEDSVGIRLGTSTAEMLEKDNPNIEPRKFLVFGSTIYYACYVKTVLRVRTFGGPLYCFYAPINFCVTMVQFFASERTSDQKEYERCIMNKDYKGLQKWRAKEKADWREYAKTSIRHKALYKSLDWVEDDFHIRK